jgi:DNA-binding Lrp family transcriptional regulator
MPQTILADDEIRVNILDALLKKRSVVPNINQIQNYTGYHKATIRSSLDFLLKGGLLEGFGPKVNFRKFGYKLEPMVMLQADLSEKNSFDSFLKAANSDSNLIRLSAIIGSGNWNLVAQFVHKDVESYHKADEENYQKKVPSFFKLIRDKQVFYTTEPYYKNVSRTKALIELIKKEKGY